MLPKDKLINTKDDAQKKAEREFCLCVKEFVECYFYILLRLTESHIISHVHMQCAQWLNAGINYARYVNAMRWVIQISKRKRSNFYWYCHHVQWNGAFYDMDFFLSSPHFRFVTYDIDHFKLKWSEQHHLRAKKLVLFPLNTIRESNFLLVFISYAHFRMQINVNRKIVKVFDCGGKKILKWIRQ